MTYQQRIIGCVVCMIVGFFLSMGSIFRLDYVIVALHVYMNHGSDCFN